MPLVVIAAACRPRGEDAPPPPPPHALPTAILRGVPFVAQEPDFCGEACVAMATARLGHAWDQDAVFAAAQVDPALGRGAYTRELAAAVKRIGFDPGPVWTTIDAHDPQPGLADAFAALDADLARGVPSIVCMHYDDRPDTTEHFRLITGYDAQTDELVYQEPAEADGGDRRMSRARFLALWPLRYDKDAWTLIRIALAPVALHDPAPPRAGGPTPAAYAQHVRALRAKLAHLDLGDLSIRVEPPFVVVGDGGPDELARRARTVRWAADHLEHDFFDHRPTRILDVYLFGDATSYRHGAGALAQDPPDTPYGFYSPDADALIMNIATGGGTLVHEIVHPYVEADFPGAPPWLNEGLGSLFEQSDERDGHIVGLTNWRLAGLQRGLAAGVVPSFRELTSLDEHAFYADDTGVDYAASRYLLYWLQQRGQLRAFYRAYRAARDQDPSGFDTLSATLGVKDADDARADWEAFVRTLRFPER